MHKFRCGSRPSPPHKLANPLILVPFLLFLINCNPAQETVSQMVTLAPTISVTSIEPPPTIPPSPTTQPTPEPTALPEIVMPISVYILDDEDAALSSQRTVEEVTAIYERVNDIWSQANIVIDVQTIERVTVPNELLSRIANRDIVPFFQAVNTGLVVLPNPSQMTGFYVSAIGGPNGINPFASDAFLVMDTPSVHDERVTSHEIGHIFGLHHVLDDPNRLLYSGTNGTTLSDEEIAVARYTAQGMLDGVR